MSDVAPHFEIASFTSMVKPYICKELFVCLKEEHELAKYLEGKEYSDNSSTSLAVRIPRHHPAFTRAVRKYIKRLGIGSKPLWDVTVSAYPQYVILIVDNVEKVMTREELTQDAYLY